MGVAAGRLVSLTRPKIIYKNLFKNYATQKGFSRARKRKCALKNPSAQIGTTNHEIPRLLCILSEDQLVEAKILECSTSRVSSQSK
jgi:hypothetical protein